MVWRERFIYSISHEMLNDFKDIQQYLKECEQTLQVSDPFISEIGPRKKRSGVTFWGMAN